MNTTTIQLAEAPRPRLLPNKKSEKPFFMTSNVNGKNINYFNYLIDMYKRSAKHGGIIKNKIKYIFGGGNEINFKFGLSKINEILRLAIADFEVFNGFYFEIFRNVDGKIVRIDNIPFERVVRSEDGSRFFYNPNVNEVNVNNLIELFTEPGKGREIYYYHEVGLGYELYPDAEYTQALDYINADALVAKHTYTNAKKGFRPTKHITFVNGEPTQEVKQSIKNSFSKTYEGEDGETFILDFVSDASRAAIINDLGVSLLSSEDYSSVNELIQSNIFTAHGVTSPSLFGIASEGSLGDKNNIMQAYEIFENVYVKYRRAIIEENINSILSDSIFTSTKVSLKSLPPLDLQVPEQLVIQYAPKEWVLDKLGIKPQAVAMSSDAITDDYALQVFSSFGEDASQYTSYLNEQFGAVAASDLIEVASLIYDNPSVTIEQISTATGYPTNYIEDAVNKLIDGGRLKGSDGNWKDIDMPDAQYSIAYKYSWRPEIPTSERDTADHPSRTFCKKLMSLNRFYKDSDIEKISSRLGYDVFSRAGGWWNDNGIAKPSCRHFWESKLVKKNV